MFNNGQTREAHWCRSMVHSLERQGFTVLIARNDYGGLQRLGPVLRRAQNTSTISTARCRTSCAW